jgi:hypothetical protein
VDKSLDFQLPKLMSHKLALLYTRGAFLLYNLFMPRIANKPQKKSEQFEAVDDMKVRQTLILLADKYDSIARNIIIRTYGNNALLLKYQQTRESGIYEKGGAKKVHKKLVEFPNPYVFDFVDTVLSGIYGKDWLNDPFAMRHELVRPWWVVSKI